MSTSGAKHEAFKRLANQRVFKITEGLRVLSNLSAKNNYRYSASDVEAVRTAIQTALDDCMKQFEPNYEFISESEPGE